MDSKGLQAYKEQAIYTMTQGELLLLLYDEMVKRLTRAQMSLEKENHPDFEQSITRGIEIVAYLDDVLDLQYPIGQDLHRLYDFYDYQLRRAQIGRNEKILGEVKEHVIQLRDAFRAAQKNNDSGR